MTFQMATIWIERPALPFLRPNFHSPPIIVLLSMNRMQGGVKVGLQLLVCNPILIQDYTVFRTLTTVTLLLPHPVIPIVKVW